VAAETILELDRVYRRFGGLEAIRDVSMSVPEGARRAIIGPNGAGKTTLFNIITGELAATAGRLRFFGRDITGLPAHARAALGLGRTFQITKPFLKLTVLENVIIGALNRTSSVHVAGERAKEILAQMNLADKLSVQGKYLSVPERKRLEIARALATEPKLLLLDEVMAGLNPVELDEIIDVLRRLAEEGISLFIVEHIMHAIMTISQRVMVLHHGETIAVGTPKEIAHDEQVIEAYLGEEYSLA